jgi:hypothetical protein
MTYCVVGYCVMVEMSRRISNDIISSPGTCCTVQGVGDG